MAPANQSAPHRLPGAAPVTLLYIRGTDADLPYLDRGLSVLADRYAPQVELQTVCPADTPAKFARWAERTPTVLVLRRGEIVGEAIGAFLPMRELDRVVRCAVEWAR